MRILYIEPFHGGSHQAFGDALMSGIDADWTPLILPSRHWKWRMRGSAAWFALEHRDALAGEYDLILASSYLPLTELVGLCPWLSHVPRALYFHENQLAYPVRDAWSGERDTHFGFTQLVSALSATRCVFNSSFNLESFLEAAQTLLNRLPDAVPKGWVGMVRARSEVLGVPLDLPKDPGGLEDRGGDRSRGPTILWNHRWEFDKNPAGFFEALGKLKERGVPFRLMVCGERFRKSPDVFAQAKDRLGAHIDHWGYAEDRAAYERLLSTADIAVSTAIHEFFGVAMLEACHFGARPLVPDRLAYRELFPEEFRYLSDEVLVDELERLCRGWIEGREVLRADRRTLTRVHLTSALLPRYEALFKRMVEAGV